MVHSINISLEYPMDTNYLQSSTTALQDYRFWDKEKEGDFSTVSDKRCAIPSILKMISTLQQ